MPRPRPLVARISALLVLAAAGLAASGGCGQSLPIASCDAMTACASGQWCLYPDGLCGKGAASGACTAISEVSCAASAVCGCDGKVYPSVCAAAQVGTDTTDATACPAPAGKLACGGGYCDAATELCSERRVPAGATVCQNSVACAPIPAACAAMATCACLGMNGFGGTCTGDATSGLTVNDPSGC